MSGPVDGEPAVIGHRGARGTHPENTLQAISAAIRVGADGIELDVGMTRDGHLVLNHDRSLNPVITRRPDGSWLDAPEPIHRFSLAELRQFRVGALRPDSAYAGRFPKQRVISAGVPIPTLREVLSGPFAQAGRRLLAMVEIKTSAEFPGETAAPEAFVEALASELARAGTADRHDVAVASFDWRNLALARERIPWARRIHLGARRSGHDGAVPAESAAVTASVVRDMSGTIWAPDHRDLDQDAIAAARASGLQVYAWTVNHRARMADLAAMGVDAIITDYPGRALKVLGRR